MSDGPQWWLCMCGAWHDGEPRRAGALTASGVILHGPVAQSENDPAE